MADLYQEITDWSKGIQAAASADRIPLNSTPRALNSAFRNIGQGIAQIGSRPGLVTVNTTTLTGTPQIFFQQPYSFASGSAATNYQALVADNGTLRFKDADDVIGSALVPPANFPLPSATCFTVGDYLVDGAVTGNRLFLLNTNSEVRSLIDTTYYPWGLSPITTWAPTATGSGSSSMPDETYDVAATSYHSTTGGESSRATSVAVSMGGANRRIEVTITPSASESAQYSHWRVYLRRQTTQSALYLVTTLENSGGTTIVTDGNIPIATTTVYVDLSAAQIANLTTEAPSTTENNGPPTAARRVAVYGRRLIVADTRNIYWSKQDRPDNFPPLNFEPIETGEGDLVTAIYPFSDELLLIFTTTAIWGLYGNNPQTWTLKAIDRTIGCSAHQSVVDYDNQVAWWSDSVGPAVYNGSTVARLALDSLGAETVIDNVEASRLDHIVAGHDPQGYRVVWAVPSLNNTTTLDVLLPYNYRVGAWESNSWTPLAVASLSTGYIDGGTQRLFVGGTEGQLFYFDAATFNDGVPSGTTTGTYTPASTSTATLTGTGFYTTGSGLLARKVLVTDSDNRPFASVTIASNTSTTLTLTSTLAGLNAGSVYNYYIGSPNFRFYTKFLDLDQTFIRKRFDRVYLQLESQGTTASSFLTSQINFVDESRPAQDILETSGSAWDDSLWDTFLWAGTGLLKKRLSLLRSAQSVRVILFHFTPNSDIIINSIGVLARPQSDRYFG